MKFTIEEIRNYIIAEDSLGDVLYNLSEENIDKANIKWERGELEYEDKDEREKTYIMNGTSPSGKKYTASGIYVCDELEKIEYIEEVSDSKWDDPNAAWNLKTN